MRNDDAYCDCYDVPPVEPPVEIPRDAMDAYGPDEEPDEPVIEPALVDLADIPGEYGLQLVCSNGLDQSPVETFYEPGHLPYYFIKFGTSCLDQQNYASVTGFMPERLARLMAAAPALLGACQAIIAVFDGVEDPSELDASHFVDNANDIFEAAIKARAAIAKATT